MSWIQIGSDIDGETVGDDSGYSVSLSADGTIVAIGSTLNDGNGTNTGHVRIYEWNGTSWTQKGTDIDGITANEKSGFSVDLSSDGLTVAIGSPKYPQGIVRIYIWNGTSWIQKGSDIIGENNLDEFGYSVNLSSNGDVVVIGAIKNNEAGVNSGHVRVYEYTGESWIQKGIDIDGLTGYKCGWSVSINSDGNTIALSCVENNSQTGEVKIYDWNGTNWIQKGSDITGSNTGDYFGNSISLSSNGNIIAIGSPYNDNTGNNAGCVRIYTWNGTNWIQRGIDINGENNNDYFGWSVSLSSNGNDIAIGANQNSNFQGSVYIYNWNGSSWTQKGNTITGVSSYDLNGWSVSLSSDGSIVAIGAPYHDGTGHVRIYEYPLQENNGVCYIGESKVLVQDINNQEIKEVCVKDITKDNFLVYSTTQEKFVPVKVNCISGEMKYFIVIKKNSIRENVPSEDFYVTPTHPILIDGKEIEARLIKNAQRVILKKQLIYTIVTDKRESVLINNLDVMTWEYSNFMKVYNALKKIKWINNLDMRIIDKQDEIHVKV